MTSRPLVNGRAQVVMGDATSHGGKVISGSPTTFFGPSRIPIARVGDMTSCPLCPPHVFPIVEGDPIFTDNYMRVALHGHKTACGATLIAVEVPPPSAVKVANAAPLDAVVGPSGNSTLSIVNVCPEFKASVKRFEAHHGSISYGKKGKGTYIDKDDPSNMRIIIDSNERGHPVDIAQSISHELGHAEYKIPDFFAPPPTMTKQQFVDYWVNENLLDEAHATFNNLEMRSCVLNAGGPDIGVPGEYGEDYKKMYESYRVDHDKSALIRKIADKFSTEHPSTNPSMTYREYYSKSYEDWWNENR